MRILKASNKESAKKLFKDIYVYHCSSFSPKLAVIENRLTFKEIQDHTRWQFLYGNYGLVANINNFSNWFYIMFFYNIFIIKCLFCSI